LLEVEAAVLVEACILGHEDGLHERLRNSLERYPLVPGA
jgi:hypothetical protein